MYMYMYMYMSHVMCVSCKYVYRYVWPGLGCLPAQVGWADAAVPLAHR